MVTAIIAAAGSGKRMGAGKNKVFIPLLQCPILVRSVLALVACPEVDSLVITAAKDEIMQVEQVITDLGIIKPWQVVAGGDERQHSIVNALKAIPEETEIIAVHDGARPLIEPETVRRVIAAAREHRAAGVAVPVKDTIKIVNEEGFIIGTPERRTLWAIQTPQAFEASLLRQAYQTAAQDGYCGTDDASLVERLGVQVKVVLGSYLNLKVTTPEDVIIAEALLKEGRDDTVVRVGIGYDVHRLVEGRKLILGGVDIPYTYGLDGHSDADVLLHAIKDALLGAAALGDIGRHFPDTDTQYKGASSIKLLVRVNEILAEHGYKVNNVDATIVVQKPKLALYIEAMNTNIAVALGAGKSQVNVKATTTEGLGFTGSGEGIAAYATVSIVQG